MFSRAQIHANRITFSLASLCFGLVSAGAIFSGVILAAAKRRKSRGSSRNARADLKALLERGV
jgi:hypothetical protein